MEAKLIFLYKILLLMITFGLSLTVCYVFSIIFYSEKLYD